MSFRLSSKLLMFLLTCFSILETAAQGTTTQAKAIDFNNALVAISDTLYLKGRAWENLFNESYETREFQKLTSTRKDLEGYVDRKIQQVSSMKDVAGSEKLRKALIKFLSFEKEMISKAFVPIENLSSSATQAEIKSAYENLKVMVTQEDEALKIFGKEQEAYAAKNGFTIEEEE